MPLALALVCLRRTPQWTAREFGLVLFVFAWALSIGVEFLYVRDAFDDRMNTLFKFYYQAWTLYAIAAAISLAVLWQAARIPWQRAILAAATTASILAGLSYPVVASYQWTEGFAAWQGLDGLAYGEEISPDEVAAIRWLARLRGVGRRRGRSCWLLLLSLRPAAVQPASGRSARPAAGRWWLRRACGAPTAYGRPRRDGPRPTPRRHRRPTPRPAAPPRP